MNRNCAFLFLVIASFFLAEGIAQEHKKPNILLAKDMEYANLSHQNNVVQIPVHDKLAAEVINSRIYPASSACSPSGADRKIFHFSRMKQISYNDHK